MIITCAPWPWRPYRGDGPVPRPLDPPAPRAHARPGTPDVAAIGRPPAGTRARRRGARPDPRCRPARARSRPAAAVALRVDPRRAARLVGRSPRRGGHGTRSGERPGNGREVPRLGG